MASTLSSSLAPTYELRLPCYCKENCSSCGIPREGDLKILPNHHLRVNETTDYIVTHFLGRGVFGQVVQSIKLQTGKNYAIKVLKNTPSYYEQGKTELNVLLRLLQKGAEHQPVAHLVEAFEMQGHLCLVFELYRENVYEFLKKNRFTPLSVANIRYIGFQLLQALEFLLACKVIHTDIKPENVMFVSNSKRPFEIRLIDFGSAVFSDKPSQECCYLQSRYYRSPEVLVRSEITAASDMFSVGCVLAELYIGFPLMAGNNEYEQIKLIMEMIGPLPNSLIATGKSGMRFFNFYLSHGDTIVATLKSEDQVDRLSVFRERRKPCHNIRRLQDLTLYKRPSHYEEGTRMLLPQNVERAHFTDLLTKMLCTNPKARIQPQMAKCHNFFKFSYDAVSFGLTPPAQPMPTPTPAASVTPFLQTVHHQPPLQTLQQQQQQHQQNVINQYIPALTTIYQQLSYAPAVYVQNVQIPQNMAAANAAAVQYATTVAALAPNGGQQVVAQAPSVAPSAVAAAAAIYGNPAFGHVIQQLIAPSVAQYAAAAASNAPQTTFQIVQPQPMHNAAAAAAAAAAFQQQQQQMHQHAVHMQAINGLIFANSAAAAANGQHHPQAVHSVPVDPQQQICYQLQAAAVANAALGRPPSRSRSPL